MKIVSAVLLILFHTSLLAGVSGNLQNVDSLASLRGQALRLYLDCDRCDEDFIRTAITFVNYVRERREAQVHLLVTDQSTASGGREYTLTYLGQREFTGKNDTLVYISRQFDSDEVVRAGLARMIKMGLMSYIARTPLADRLSISFDEEIEAVVAEDPWDSWVFKASAYADADGEQTTSELDLSGSIRAERITDNWKIRTSLNQSYEREVYTIDEETITSVTHDQSVYGLAVISLNDHWSAGVTAIAHASTYENIRGALYLAPAVSCGFCTA
jgi:hypothetical protein